MKVAIITFHNTSNFGATLQCCALSRYMKMQGYNVEIINYLPQYVLDKKSVYKELKKVGESGNKARALIKGIAYLSYSGILKRRDDKFEVFIQRNLTLTKRYGDYDSLLQDPPVADYYICGSDQIWNPVLTGKKLDKAFFLQFAQGLRAAYGASIGELDVDMYARELIALTDSFIGISVRERSAAERLKNALGKNVEVVLDCTLLLSKDDYQSMEEDVVTGSKPYLLLYNIQNSADSIALAKKIAGERGLVIVDMSPNPFAKVDGAKKIIDAGPGEFLSYIRRADYVVTNSFHGTVFSIIYGKPFFTIPHKTRSDRTADLLRSLHLEERLVIDPNRVEDCEIDYKKVYATLSELRTKSFGYLDKILVQNGPKEIRAE